MLKNIVIGIALLQVALVPAFAQDTDTEKQEFVMQKPSFVEKTDVIAFCVDDSTEECEAIAPQRTINPRHVCETDTTIEE